MIIPKFKPCKEKFISIQYPKIRPHTHLYSQLAFSSIFIEQTNTIYHILLLLSIFQAKTKENPLPSSPMNSVILGKLPKFIKFVHIVYMLIIWSLILLLGKISLNTLQHKPKILPQISSSFGLGGGGFTKFC